MNSLPCGREIERAYSTECARFFKCQPMFTGRSIAFTLACFSFTSSAALSQDLAASGLQPRIEALSQDSANNSFELGALKTLRAVEKSLQTRYKYGLGDRIARIPLLRLTAGGMPNLKPLPSSPTTLSEIVTEFEADMRDAQSSLSNAKVIQPFTMTLQDIWFDINADGVRDRDEDATEMLLPLVLNRTALRDYRKAQDDIGPIEVRFDEADHEWLMAYTHMLAAIANLYLAFDPAPVLADLQNAKSVLSKAPNLAPYYNPDELQAELTALTVEVETMQHAINVLKDERAALGKRKKEIRDLLASETQNDIIAKLKEESRELKAESSRLSVESRPLNQSLRSLQNEIRAIEAKLDPENSGPRWVNDDTRSMADFALIVLKSLEQQPDVAHMQAARDDWRAMISHNRQFWSALSLETDNDREWIPNPQQTAALGIEIPESFALAWQKTLEDAEALLEGHLLIPHSLLPAGSGISLSAYFDNPAPLNLIDWIHGIGAYPYVAKGPVMTEQNWQAFNRLTGGRAGGFALFFN